jgi:hypothetical protein
MPMLVGLIPAIALFLITLAIGWLSPFAGVITFVAAVYLCWIVLTVWSYSIRPRDIGLNPRLMILNQHEEAVFKLHYLFFKYPFAAGNFTHFLNFSRIFGIAWIAICVWQQLYVLAGLLVVFYIAAGWLMVRLYPVAHYQVAANKGQLFATQQLMAIERIIASRDMLDF